MLVTSVVYTQMCWLVLNNCSHKTSTISFIASYYSKTDKSEKFKSIETSQLYRSKERAKAPIQSDHLHS